MAQQARPNVTGQMDERRAHATILSTVVVNTRISSSSMSITFVTPVENPLAPDVDIAGGQDGKKDNKLNESGPAQLPQRHGERIEEGNLDVEQQEDHRHQVELDGVAVAG